MISQPSDLRSQLWARNVLILAPHADDEVIGCGGLLSLLRERATVRVAAVGNYTNRHGVRVLQSQRMAELSSALGELGVDQSQVAVLFDENNVDGRLDLRMAELVTACDHVMASVKPSAVFLPAPSHHQDHRALHDAALASLRLRPGAHRPSLIAQYYYAHHDDPVMSAWSAPPNLLLPLDRGIRSLKERALAQYKSQFQNGSQDPLLQWYLQRGDNLAAPYGLDHAEAFNVLYMSLI